MKASTKILREILLDAFDRGDFACEDDIIILKLSEERILEMYDQFIETERHWDYESEFREGEETNIEADWSRNYESKSVAKQMNDGSWVGWTYWYGGGKHGNSHEIPWIDDAYYLDCVEEEKTIIVKTFTKT